MFARRLFIAAIAVLAIGLLGLLSRLPAEAPLLQAEKPAPAAAPAADKDKDAKPATGPRSRVIHKRLAQVVTIAIDANTPLRDALKFISETYRVPILIDRKAFEAIGVQKVEDQPVELPKMTDVRLARVLQKLLKEIRGDAYVGTFQVRPDHIEVTTTYNQMAECPAAAPDHPALIGAAEPLVPAELWGDPSRKMSPVVHFDADHRPFAEAIRDLCDDVEMDVVIDRRAGEKVQTQVDLTLNNVLFDTGISLLVEQADLDWMWIDNLVYVSTKDEIKARRDKKKAAEQEKVKMLREARELQNPAGAPAVAQPGLGVPGAMANPFQPLPAPPPAKPLGLPRPIAPPAQ